MDYPEGIQVGQLPGEFTGLQLQGNIDIAISKARSENIKLSFLFHSQINSITSGKFESKRGPQVFLVPA